jgi:hypothetical protein
MAGGHLSASARCSIGSADKPKAQPCFSFWIDANA